MWHVRQNTFVLFFNQPKHQFPMVLAPLIRTPSFCFYPPFFTPWFYHSNPVPSMSPVVFSPSNPNGASRCGQGPWGITIDEQANKLRRCLEEESGDSRVDGGKAEQGGGTNSVPPLLPQQQPLMVGGLDPWPCATSAASCSHCRRSALPHEQGTHRLEGRPKRTQHQPGDGAASSLTTTCGRGLGR